jgi:flavin-binding protein dodecin
MYYVFAGDNYYPSGGSGDLVGFSESLDEAVTMALQNLGNDEMRKYRWAEVCGTDDVKGLVTEWEG